MCFRAGIAHLEWFSGFLSERLLAREDAKLPVGHCMSDGILSPEQRCGTKAQSAGQNATELQPKTLQRRTSKIARCRSVSAHANVGDKRGLTTRRGTGRAARHGRRGTGGEARAARHGRSRCLPRPNRKRRGTACLSDHRGRRLAGAQALYRGVRSITPEKASSYAASEAQAKPSRQRPRNKPSSPRGAE